MMRRLFVFLLAAGVVCGLAAAGKSKRPARITSENTYYDHKQGVAVFTGHVHVDDEEYQMNADKAYAFTEGTNGLSRVVAVGHVAMTNGTKRAFGDRVSYYRTSGMVVLHSGNGVAAEVRDETNPAEPRVVRGEKIKFWIDSEQVEVIKSTITAPASLDGKGKSGLKGIQL